MGTDQGQFGGLRSIVGSQVRVGLRRQAAQVRVGLGPALDQGAKREQGGSQQYPSECFAFLTCLLAFFVSCLDEPTTIAPAEGAKVC